MDKQRIEKCIDDIKSNLNAISTEINKRYAKVYLKRDLEDMYQNDDSYMLSTIYVQDRLGSFVSAAVLDTCGGLVAVTGVQMSYSLSDYGVTWIAWDSVPTREQIDAIRWPKGVKNPPSFKPDYLFGEENENG